MAEYEELDVMDQENYARHPEDIILNPGEMLRLLSRLKYWIMFDKHSYMEGHFRGKAQNLSEIFMGVEEKLSDLEVLGSSEFEVVTEYPQLKELLELYRQHKNSVGEYTVKESELEEAASDTHQVLFEQSTDFLVSCLTLYDLETICKEKSHSTLLGAIKWEYHVAEHLISKLSYIKAQNPSVYEEVVSTPDNLFTHEKLQAAWEWGAKLKPNCGISPPGITFHVSIDRVVAHRLEKCCVVVLSRQRRILML